VYSENHASLAGWPFTGTQARVQPLIDSFETSGIDGGPTKADRGLVDVECGKVVSNGEPIHPSNTAIEEGEAHGCTAERARAL
jgi:hypothetical protein